MHTPETTCWSTVHNVLTQPANVMSPPSAGHSIVAEPRPLHIRLSSEVTVEPGLRAATVAANSSWGIYSGDMSPGTVHRRSQQVVTSLPTMSELPVFSLPPAQSTSASFVFPEHIPLMSSQQTEISLLTVLS